MNKNEFDPKDESSSLSDMINEYDNDNALRNKIEAIKKQKAMEEEARKQAEIQRRLDEIEQQKQTSVKSTIPVDNTTEIPSMASSQPFMNADADVTQVFNAEDVNPLDDGDKTLVIMDNAKQRNFNTDDRNESPRPASKQPEEQIERLAPEFEVNDEQITEDDIEEYLPEDNKKAKKPKKPVNPDKMNKTITYVIAGIAGLCVIGLIVFGLNFFGVFGGGNDNKTLKLDEVTLDEKTNKEEIGANNFTLKGSEVEKITDTKLIELAKAEAKSTEDGTKVQVSTVDKSALKSDKGTYKVTFATNKGTKVTVKATVSESAKSEEDNKEEEEPESDQKDNSAKINELEGQIKINNDQITALQADITTYQGTVDGAEARKTAINNEFDPQLTTALSTQEQATKNYNNAKVAYDADQKNETLKAQLQEAETKKNSADTDVNTISSTKTEALNAVDADVSSANTNIAANNQKIIELQNDIIDLQKQLEALK